MNRGKRCPARAVVFMDGEKYRCRCEHLVDYHTDQIAFEKSLRGKGPVEMVQLSHSVRFADGVTVTWDHGGEIIYRD